LNAGHVADRAPVDEPRAPEAALKRFRIAVPAAFTLTVATVVTTFAVTAWNLDRLAENNAWVTHTHDVLNTLEETISALKDAESGYRGYHATGEDGYLLPYRTALTVVPDRIARLKVLTTDNRGQQARLAAFEAIAAAALAHFRTGVAIRRARGWTASQEYMVAGKGKAEMIAARAAITEMEAVEQVLLVQRARESAWSYETALATTAASGVMALAMVAIAYWLTVRDRRAREESAQALRAARDHLEQRVADRTVELQAEVLERRRAEDDLRVFSRRLEESNRELEQFATIASHDLQEPLRKIQAFGDRLQKDCGPALDGPGTEFLGRILNSAGRMRTLIDDLLTFSRVGRKGRPFVPVDLALAAREVVSDLEGRVRQAGGRVEIGPLPTIEADPTQVRQLFQNLIGNALKFRKPDEPPVVHVDARLDPGADGPGPGVCALTVRDNGIGFDQEYADRIFQMFQRLHGRGQYEGNGIGLAICRRIVERHNGQITATSTPGAGATFVVTLPVEQSQRETSLHG
jgi:signal transduction histidine kinase